MFFLLRACGKELSAISSRLSADQSLDLSISLDWQPTAASREPSCQKFRKYSGIATRYFKLRVQRRTILIGSAAMNSSRLANTM